MMSDSKKISVVIPCYNDGVFLPEAVNSVLCCDESLVEIIIVNDGSTDSLTINILSEYEAKGIQVIHQENSGLAAARNAGIRKATGTFILPLDSDNKIHKEYPERAIEVFERYADIDVVYGKPQFFGDSNEQPLVGSFSLQKLMTENFIDACAVFRKSVWEEVGGYDENMPFMGAEDWDFWLRLGFARKKFHFINEILFDYRVRRESMLRSTTTPRIKEIKSYIAKKYPYYIDFDSVDTYLENKAKYNTFFFLMKFFIKLKMPFVYNFLLKKGFIRV
jgi:glycosyltransferase involved in cell wall biosynthesis